jgi:hypothetical protein
MLQIPELIEFEDRLENSLQRDLAKMEHVRMRVFHEPVSTDLTDMELIELKFIFARRESICFTPKTMSVEPFCQCTTTTVTTRSSPITNPDTDLLSKTRPLYSDRNLGYVSDPCHGTIQT